MITIDKLLEKKAYYVNTINTLNSEDIEAKATKRLEAMKPQIIEEIKKEIEKDVIACKYYLELLDDLIQSEENKTEEPAEETEEIKSEEINEGEINNEL